YEQSFVRVVVLVRPPALPPLRPGDMRRALSVTRLTADADLGPAGGEAVIRSVVILVHACRVAFGAHEVPILIELGPVQHIVVADFLMRIEVEPPLAAFALGARIPGKGQCLEAGVGELEEILLKGVKTGDVLSIDRRRITTR